jgi:hypothetical protein
VSERADVSTWSPSRGSLGHRNPAPVLDTNANCHECNPTEQRVREIHQDFGGAAATWQGEEARNGKESIEDRFETLPEIIVVVA